MMKSILAGAALALIASPALAQEAEAPTEQLLTTDAEIITAKVNGMVCDFCARAVTKVFGKRDEVDTVDVDLDTGEIHITMKSGDATLDDETVKKLVKKSGYALVSIERSSGA